MQHIATPKTDAAASTLPIDLNSTLSIESGSETGSDNNELVFANVLSEAGDKRYINNDAVVERGRTASIDTESDIQAFADTESNFDEKKERSDIDWVAFVDDVISANESTDNDNTTEQFLTDDENSLSSIISSEIETELGEDDEGRIVILDTEVGAKDVVSLNTTEGNIENELHLTALIEENEVSANTPVTEGVGNESLVSEGIQLQANQDIANEESNYDPIEDDEISIDNPTDVLFDEAALQNEFVTADSQDEVILNAASNIVTIINAIDAAKKDSDSDKLLSEADSSSDSILTIEQQEADVELVTTLFENELIDTNDVTHLATDSNISRPPILNVDDNSQFDSELASLSDDDIEAVIQNVLTVLPDSADKANFAVSLRADIVASVSDVKALLNNGQSTEQSLASIVEQSLSIDSVELTDEQTSLVLQQTIKAEQFLGLVQHVVEQANGQVNVAAQLLSSAAPTSHTNDVSLATTFDNLTAEGAIDVATQNRAQTQVQAANDLDRPVPIHQAEGQKQVAEKIRWMVGARVTAAEIRLDPPELGSMQIRINMVGETASVNFVVQSAQARDVLAQTEPQLKDMLSEQGLDLGESFVSTQDEDNSDGENGEGAAKNPLFASESDDDINVVEQPIQQKQSPYNVDAYV